MHDAANLADLGAEREARQREDSSPVGFVVDTFQGLVAQLKEKVQSSEKALHQYKKKSKILSLQSEKSLHLKELSEIRSAYNKIRVQRVELEAQIGEIQQAVSEADAGDFATENEVIEIFDKWGADAG